MFVEAMMDKNDLIQLKNIRQFKTNELYYQ